MTSLRHCILLLLVSGCVGFSKSHGQQHCPLPNHKKRKRPTTTFSLPHITLELRGGATIQVSSSGSSKSLLSGLFGKLLHITEGSLLNGPVRKLGKLLENMLGVSVLPAPNKSSKRRKNKRQSTNIRESKTTKKKRRSKQSLADKVTDDTRTTQRRRRSKREKADAPIVSTDADDKTSSKAIAPSTNKQSDTPKKTKKKKKPTVSTAAKAHLTTKIQTSNPNYRIQRELKAFLEDPPEHLQVKVGKNIRVWIVQMRGIGIYQDESFKLRIAFPKNYPTVPPSVYFLPPVPVHEHVYTNGDICLSLLGKDWRPTMTAQSIANSILSILASANSKSLPMDNSRHAQNKPGEYQEDWVYHDDNC